MFQDNRKGPISLIWDLDGTLFNSYSVIISSVCEMLGEFGIETDYDEVYRFCIKTSATDYFREMEKVHGLSFDAMKKRYTEISQKRMFEIVLMPQAKETLQALTDMGVKHYVFTHRGTSTIPVTDHLGLTEFFEEIITSVEHFPRKPEPDAVKYLMEKYQMDPQCTYYVGDRSIDMDCAVNAGIGGILYLPRESVGAATGAETVIVEELPEIIDFISYCG